MKKSVNGHDYAQAKEIIYEDGWRELISYTTTVIEITADGWMTVHGLYSRTTIKHIGWFMRELGLTYQYAKMAYERRDIEQFNVYTGEVKEVVA